MELRLHGRLPLLTSETLLAIYETTSGNGGENQRQDVVLDKGTILAKLVLILQGSKLPMHMDRCR
jgi:hypothetical protein